MYTFFKSNKIVTNFLTALLLSMAISYSIVAYKDYVIYKKNNVNYNIDLEFFINTVNYYIRDVFNAFSNLFLPTILLPFLLIAYIIYIFIVYKIFFTKINFIKKYQVLLSTLLFICFWIFLDFYSDVIVAV